MRSRTRLIFAALALVGLLAGCISTAPDDGTTTRQTWTSRTIWMGDEVHRADLHTVEQIAAPQPQAQPQSGPVSGETWILAQYDQQNGRTTGRVCPLVLGTQKMTDQIFRIGADSRCPEAMRHVTGWYPAPAPAIRSIVLTNAAGTALGTFSQRVGTYRRGQLILATGSVVEAAMREQ